MRPAKNKSVRVIASLVPAVFLAALPSAVLAATLEGFLLEKGTRRPLGGVNVFLLPSKAKATTDSAGRFRFENAPQGAFTWVVNTSGFRRLEQKDSLEGETLEPRRLFLEKDSYLTYETTVVGKQKVRDNTTRSLKREEFLQAPGSGGDPIKAVQNLPGVNRPPSFSSNIVIQGSGPQDTNYAIDGHEVPLVFHFGGLTSVVSPEAIERVDMLAAGYGPEFGRANGGWVGLWSRTPETQSTPGNLRGMGFMDLFSVGGLLQGSFDSPLGNKGRYLISGRQSYFGAVLGAAFKGNKDFNLTVAPEYRDLILIGEAPVTERDDFKLVLVGSQDDLSFLFKEPIKQDPSVRGDFSTGTAFFRIIPQLTHRHSARTVSRWSLGVGADWISVETGENYFKLRNAALTARGEVERKMLPQWTAFVGFDNSYSTATVDLRLPSSYGSGGIRNPISTGTLDEATITGKTNSIGLYQRSEVLLPWSLVFLPNFRVDHFGNTGEWLFSPRPALRHDLGDGWTARAAGGIYYQAPEPQDVNAELGNPDLKSARARSLSLGGEADLRAGRKDGWVLSGDLFYKALDRLIIPSSTVVLRNGVLTPERTNNNGRGRAFGAQTQIKYSAVDWSLSLAYTISRSTRWNPSQAEYPYAYDQTHLLGLLGSMELGANWKLSSRLRYATGNPKTPVTSGVFDADNDVYVPVRGPYFSERLSPFFQLDLRLDKKWIFDTWILSTYLDIQNVTNRENPEQIQYSYDFRDRAVVSGLPIIPTIGLKGEF